MTTDYSETIHLFPEMPRN